MTEATSLIRTIPVYIACGVFAVVAKLLLTPIFWPDIEKFPWTTTGKEDPIVILAGSYNPPHLGHLAMLEYLSKR